MLFLSFSYIFSPTTTLEKLFSPTLDFSAARSRIRVRSRFRESVPAINGAWLWASVPASSFKPTPRPHINKSSWAKFEVSPAQYTHALKFQYAWWRPDVIKLSIHGCSIDLWAQAKPNYLREEGTHGPDSLELQVTQGGENRSDAWPRLSIRFDGQGPCG